MKGVSDELLNQLGKVVSASRSLDYELIIAHDKQEVAKLNRVLEILQIHPAASDESLENYARKQTSSSAGPAAASALEERRRALLEPLAEEGFAERVDKVYNSFSSERTTPIDKVPHQRGLPPYDMVLAPDFAPLAGLHGIFISGDTIMSVILPSDTQPSGEWQIVKKKRFASMEEMADMVTLIAAGFDLP